VAGRTEDRVRLEATICCNDVLRVPGMDGGDGVRCRRHSRENHMSAHDRIASLALFQPMRGAGGASTTPSPSLLMEEIR
jgi:hypothetical protein